MRFYIYTPQLFVRPKNTDWLYDQLLARLPEFNPELDIWLQRSAVRTSVENLRMIANIARSRLGVPLPRSWMPKEQSDFSLRDVARARPDVIYGQSPTNVRHVPSIFNCGPTYVDHLRASGVPEAAIEREKTIKSACADRAAIVSSHSNANLATLMDYMPQFAYKMRCLPFFLPHLQAISEEALHRKLAQKNINLLFVGREARRKGLPEVLEAYAGLSARFPGQLTLRIVTNFADGPVAIPSSPDIQLLGALPRPDVQSLLEKSHFLLMPSRFESYGWIYLEAMAAGCIALACDRPTQREILCDGSAGLLVAVQDGSETARSIQEAIEPYLAQPAALRSLANAGLQHCEKNYFPVAVAHKFEELGEEAQKNSRDELAPGKRTS